MKKVTALGLMLVSLAACDTTTSALNTVGSGVSSATNAVTSTVASGAAAVTAPAVTTTTTTTTAAAPVATTRTTKSTAKAKKTSSKSTHHSRVDRNAADGAYMGGGMVVTTPGTAVTVPSGTVVPGTTIR